MSKNDPRSSVSRAFERRRFLTSAAAGTVVLALGAEYAIADDDPRASQRRSDGRVRLPPGQRLLHRLKPMGGTPGDPSPGRWKMRIHGEVDEPFDLTFAQLLALPQTEQLCDVHCVTGWSVFDSPWKGVRVSELAKRAKVRGSARYAILEAAAGYTANLPMREALKPNVLVAHHVHGRPIPRPHGPPVRAIVPDLYFWKSAKWLTGIKFVRRDKPGYWETRGYHNHADPWREERYG